MRLTRDEIYLLTGLLVILLLGTAVKYYRDKARREHGRPALTQPAR